VFLNWWANFAQIDVPPATCPAGPNGESQIANAVILEADWVGLFNTAFWVTAVAALVIVVLTYATRVMGERFTSRWWIGLAVSSIVATAATFFLVTLPAVNTFGCEYGNLMTHVPTAPGLVRATVSLVQAAIWFLLWSLVLTRAVRIARLQPFYNNSRFPF
jgi:heme/copper-type cytochrome/quinol oxidase subunit 2